MAIVMVLVSALLLIPFMLYALVSAERPRGPLQHSRPLNPLQDMASGGWNAIYVALFGTMIGSTDAASVIAILKSGMVVAAEPGSE